MNFIIFELRVSKGNSEIHHAYALDDCIRIMALEIPLPLPLLDNTNINVAVATGGQFGARERAALRCAPINHISYSIILYSQYIISTMRTKMEERKIFMGSPAQTMCCRDTVGLDG